MRNLTTLGLFTLLLSACGRPDAAGPKNVILVCLDTVRADHLGCYGYDVRPTTPALDDLARRSTVFLDVSATACWTKPSVPSFLTGTYPLQHGVYQGSSKDEEGATSDILPAASLTIAEVLQERGYQTAAFVRNAQLRRGQGFEQGFDVYADEMGDARQIRWHASDWLDARDTERPFFLYLHMLDAHWPYDIPDEEAARFASAEAVSTFRGQDWRDLRRRINSGALQLDAAQRDELIALYDGALRYMDEQLGLLVARLEREGLLEDTVISVVSDHGEEFLEHGRIGHGHGLYEGLLAVPWILYAPDGEAREIDAPCSLVDLFPTLLTAAGVRAPASEGIDRLSDPGAERVIFSEHLEPGGYEQAWRAGFAKHLRRLEARERPAPAATPEFAPGQRLEVRLDGAATRATRVRPSSGDDDKPLELKGTVSAFDGESFVVCGVRVAFDDSTETYGETRTPAGELRALRDGLMVKAVGALDASGAFTPEKIKLYADDEEVEIEVRGPLQGTADDGRWSIGGVLVAIDENTDVEGPSRGSRMTRLEAVSGVTQELDGELDPAAWVELVRYELERDPREQDPLPGGEHARGGPGRSLLRRLLETRVWSRSDSSRVTTEELRRLQAIGYAE